LVLLFLNFIITLIFAFLFFKIKSICFDQELSFKTTFFKSFIFSLFLLVIYYIPIDLSIIFGVFIVLLKSILELSPFDILMVTPSSSSTNLDTVTELDYFNSLLRTRDKYIRLFENSSQRVKRYPSSVVEYNIHQENKLRLDKVSVEIKKFVDTKGYMDPADFNNSANNSDVE
jgi:hypothetical protein